jgi:beta-lactamase regulating signal transducer with metallopeptidase domain
MISLSEAVSAAGFELLISLAAKGLVLLASAIALNIVLRRASAALRHQIWSLALLGLLGLPALSLALPSWEISAFSFYTKSSETRSDLRITADTEAAQNVAVPFRQASPESNGKPSVSLNAAPADDQTAVGMQAAGAELETVAPDPPSIAYIFTWALAIWLAGALIVLARLLAGTATVWWMTRRAEAIIDSEWLSLTKELSYQLQLNRRALLLLSKQVTMPLTCGLLRAAILLPAEASEWTAERRRIVLLHELAHVKRRDCLIQALAHIACALHWFNPLIWLSVHWMRIEREMACDDHVLHTGTKATDYAGHLLDIARRFRSARGPSFAAVAIARRSQLEGRLLAILDPDLSRRGLNRTASLLIAFVALIVVVALSALQPLARAESEASLPATVLWDGSRREAYRENQRPDAPLSTEKREIEPRVAIEPSADNLDAHEPETDSTAEPAPPQPDQPGQPAQPEASPSQDDRNATAEALLLALKDEDLEVRQHALFALAQLGGPQLAEALRNALRDPSPEIREIAIQAAALGRGGDFTDELIAATKDGNSQVREKAVWALGLKGNQRAVDTLVSALRDESADVRVKAAWALGLKGDQRAVEPLIQALKDSSADLRETAAWALGLRGDKRAMKPLSEALKDQNKEVRAKASWALGMLLMRNADSDGADTRKEDLD